MSKRFCLNGWQRLGMVLSVLWIIFATISYLVEIRNHPFSRGKSTPSYVSSFLFEWEDLLADPKFQALSPEAKIIVLGKIDPSFALLSPAAQQIVVQKIVNPTSERITLSRPVFKVEGFSSWAFAPVAAMWLLAYLSIWTVRWVKRGFTDHSRIDT